MRGQGMRRVVHPRAPGLAASPRACGMHQSLMQSRLLHSLQAGLTHHFVLFRFLSSCVGSLLGDMLCAKLDAISPCALRNYYMTITLFSLSPPHITCYSTDLLNPFSLHGEPRALRTPGFPPLPYFDTQHVSLIWVTYCALWEHVFRRTYIKGDTECPHRVR